MNIEVNNYFCKTLNERFLNTRWKELEFEKEILSFVQAFILAHLNKTYEINYEVEGFMYIVSIQNTKNEVLFKIMIESSTYEFKYMMIDNIKVVWFNN